MKKRNKVAKDQRELGQGLANGVRDFPPSHQCIFFDYLKAVVSYEEFGLDREKWVAELDDIEKNDGFSFVQTLLPWVTDVFIYGILAGEEAQNDAKRELLGRYAEFPETAAVAQAALSLDRMRMVAGGMCGKPEGEESVLAAIRQMLDGVRGEDGPNLSEVRWCLKYLPAGERDSRRLQVLEMLGRQECKKDAAASVKCFCGKYAAVPAALGMEEAYDGLRTLSFGGAEDMRETFVRNKCLWFEADGVYQAELTKAVKRCARTRLSDEMTMQGMGNAVEALLASNDADVILSMRYVSDGVKERIANGIIGIQLLWALSYSASRRMNVRGSGAIPAFGLAGRITRDGREIETSADALYSVNHALDDMVERAVCQLAAGRELDGVTIVTYEPFREYREGEFSDKYLFALIDNAVANKKYLVVRPKDAPYISTISGDAPQNPDADEGTGTSIIDAVEDENAHAPDDYSRFIFKVTKRFAPAMWLYLRLVTWGISASDLVRVRERGMPGLADKYDPGDLVSKGDALKMVGAKTPHLVERERAVLLKALEGVTGCDYQEMARKLKKALEK